MYKILTFLLALLVTLSSFAKSSSSINPGTKPARPNAADVVIPVGPQGQTITLLDLSRMSVKELENCTGKKMKLVDKVGFKIAQKQLRSSINPDGTINEKRLAKAASKKAIDGSGFHLGGFALGFLLGIIGVLIAYLIKDELKATRVKWSWIGFALLLLILIIFAIV